MDPITPVEPVSGTGNPPQQAEDYKPRFDGAIRKIEELTIANRQLTADLAAKASETEQLRVQLSTKDVEKSVSASEYGKQLQEAIQKNQTLESQVAELQALKLKVKVINELKRPELLKIMDKLPNMSDEEALKVVMQDFANFADDLVHDRERQLMSGITPTLSSSAQAPVMPTSGPAWENYINSLALGSKERAKAFEDYGHWVEKQT